MDSVALWVENLPNAGRNNVNRSFRSSSKILDLSEESFIKNFRLSKDAFLYVLDEISSEFNSSIRAHAIDPKTKLATALKFLGQGGYQHQIGQDRSTGLSQSSVSSTLTEVCNAVQKVLCPKHINFAMSDEEKRRAKHNFFRKSKIPGVIGAIDGTHIQIIRPVLNEHLYLNRKLKHSINAMVICDDEMRIRAANARFGGACHDSHVWNLSAERQFLMNIFKNGNRSNWLLGDSGYPLEPWILTPYRSPRENSAEANFNNNFAKGRSIVERTFGLLKGRFRCLLAARELHYSPLKAIKIFNTCCAFHNICLDFKVPEPSPTYDEDTMTDMVENISNNPSTNYRNIASRIRDEIKRNMT